MSRPIPGEAETTPPSSPFATLMGAVVARRGVLISLGLLGGLGLAANLVWRSVEPGLRLDPQYLVTPNSVAVTPPPPWVRDDVVQAAFDRGGLTGRLSILAPPEELEQSLAEAFTKHPWVRSVEAIQKSAPNRVTLTLGYRSPLAAVRTPSGGLLPIDADGVLLPSANISRDQLRSMPRIEIASPPAAQPPTVGAPWADRRVAGAAALIAAFGPAWAELDLFRVRPAPTPQVRGAVSFDTFEISSTGSTLIRWGAAPGFGPPDEAAFEEKLDRLRRFVARNGPLNSGSTIRGVLNVQRGIDYHPRVVLRDADEASPEDDDSVVK